MKQIRDVFKLRQPNTVFEDVKINMKFNSKKMLYEKGYKYCNKCNYMVKTDVVYCPECGRRYRTTFFNSYSRRGRLFTESIVSLGVIDAEKIGKGVIVK